MIRSSQTIRPMWRGLTRCGAASTEYILILALVVLPLGLLLPLFLNMISIYGNRMLTFIGLPFP